MNENVGMDTGKQQEYSDVPPSVPVTMMLFFGGFELVCNTVNQYLTTPLPTRCLTAFLCLITGTIMYASEMTGSNYQGLMYSSVEDAMALALPFYFVGLVYQMEFYLYTDSLLKFSFLFLTRCLVTSFVVSVFLIVLVLKDWTFWEVMLTTVIFLPTQPQLFINRLSEIAKYQNLACFLEAESIGTFISIWLVSQYIQAIYGSDVVLFTDHLLYWAWKVGGGILFGFLSAFIISRVHNFLYFDYGTLSTALVCFNYIIYLIATYLLEVSGLITMIIVSTQLLRDRPRLAQEVDELIDVLYTFFKVFLEGGFTGLYVTESVAHMLYYGIYEDIYSSLFVYCLISMSRILYYQGMVFRLRNWKMNMEYDIGSAFLMGWSGLPGFYNLWIAFTFFTDGNTLKYGRLGLSYMCFIYFYYVFANSFPFNFIIRFLGFSTLSSLRRINMNFSVNVVLYARYCTLKALRRNKFMADGNWFAAREVTDIEYMYVMRSIETDARPDLFEAHSGICPVCYGEVPYDLTETELDRLCFEAKTRILKSKKVSIIKQYEAGVINRRCSQILLHHMDLMMESTRSKLTLDLNLKPHRFLVWLRRKFSNIKDRDTFEPPENKCLLCFYYYTNNTKYDYTMIGLILFYEAGLIILGPKLYIWTFLYHLIFNVFFTINMLMTLFWLKTMHNFVKHGWIFLDVLCCTTMMSLLLLLHQNPDLETFHVPAAFLGFSILRCTFILHHLKTLLPLIIKAIDHRIDLRIHQGFDMASALDFCCTDIIDTLPQIVEMKLIRDLYIHEIRIEKTIVQAELQRIQKERPWIAVTMKTKQIIRTTLNAMYDSLNGLKISGYVDRDQYTVIENVLKQRLKVLRSIGVIPPPTPRTFFSEIPWLRNHAVLCDILFSQASVRRFQPGEVVALEGEHLPGIFLLYSGVLRTTYRHQPQVLKVQAKYGRLPVVDYLSTIDFETDIDCDILPGSTVGEKSFLTRRAYDCTVTAVTKAKAFLIRKEFLYAAVDRALNPVSGIEANMWKSSCVNVAFSILITKTINRSLTTQDLKYKLHRAVVPDLSSYKALVVTENMQEILVLQGAVMDNATKKLYVAPAIIPKNVQKLLLDKKSVMEKLLYAETKLLIVPTAPKTGFQVMYHEEKLAELVLYPEPYTLLHPLSELPGVKQRVVKETYHPDVFSRPSVLELRPRPNIVIKTLDYDVVQPVKIKFVMPREKPPPPKMQDESDEGEEADTAPGEDKAKGEEKDKEKDESKVEGKEGTSKEGQKSPTGSPKEEQPPKEPSPPGALSKCSVVL